MANPTSAFGWQMPTSSDLVTDLPADFETFGQAVDTSLADLKGGTTGQVLSKASNTDMDFTWVAQDDSNAIQNTIVDAKGDLIAASAADTPARLAVGANGQTLVPDSTAATGLKWSNNAPLGGMTELSGGGIALTGATTITLSGISGKSRLTVIVNGGSAGANALINLRFNSDTGANYGYGGCYSENGVLKSAFNISGTSIPFAKQGSLGTDLFSGTVNLEGAFSSGMAAYNLGTAANGINFEAYNWSGWYISTGGITSISLISSSGNFDNGTMYVYGA